MLVILGFRGKQAAPCGKTQLDARVDQIGVCLDAADFRIECVALRL